MAAAAYNSEEKRNSKGKGKGSAPSFPKVAVGNSKGKQKGEPPDAEAAALRQQFQKAKKVANSRLMARTEQIEERDRRQTDYVRTTTRIEGPDATKLREAYKHEDEMLNWYPVVRDITFETHFMPLSPVEKSAILFEFFYGIANHWQWHKFSPDDDKMRKLFAHFWPEDASQENARRVLEELEARIDAVIASQFQTYGAFVKLYTSSPKDAPSNFERARNNYEERMRAADKQLTDDERWVEFYTESIRANKVTTGKGVVELLVSSKKVAIDIIPDLEELESLQVEGEEQGIGLAIRAYNPAVTPAHEFRSFVWDGQLTAVTQTLCFVVKEVLENEARIKTAVSDFFEREVKPRICSEAGVFGERLRQLGQLPRHFTMDLLWDPSADPREVTLIEINPFEGEDWSVYKDSTGLYTLKASWWEEECIDLSDAAELGLVNSKESVVRRPLDNKYYQDKDTDYQDFDIIFGFRSFDKSERRHPNDEDFVDFRFTRGSPDRDDIFKDYMNTHPDWLRLIYGNEVFEEVSSRMNE